MSVETNQTPLHAVLLSTMPVTRMNVCCQPGESFGLTFRNAQRSNSYSRKKMGREGDDLSQRHQHSESTKIFRHDKNNTTDESNKAGNHLANLIGHGEGDAVRRMVVPEINPLVAGEKLLASARLQEFLKLVVRCEKYILKRELLASASEVSFVLPEAVCEKTTFTLSKSKGSANWELKIVSDNDEFRSQIKAALPWLQGQFIIKRMGHIDVSINKPFDE